MPTLKTIRKRIVSTKATQKITRAMKMVAGARLTRAQQRIVSMRPYALKTAEVLQNVAQAMTAAAGDAGSLDRLHPLLEHRPERRVLLVVLTSDRGLCGAFNTNIQKATERTWKAKEAEGATVTFITVGKKGREYLQRRKADIANDFKGVYEALDIERARGVAHFIVSRYVKRQADAEPQYDAVYLIYNEFKSAIAQKLTVERLLPLPDAAPAKDAHSDATGTPAVSLYMYEPDQGGLLERLVPMYIEVSIFRALLESQASEFGARMTAMDAATRNAKDMISRLTLLYNRARQAAITKELMEIIGGAEALKE